MRTIYFAFSLCLLTSSCTGLAKPETRMREEEGAQVSSSADMFSSAAVLRPAPMTPLEPRPKTMDQSPPVNPSATRKVVYTGAVDLVVSSRQSALERIAALVEAKGGLVVRSSLAQIVVRVPPAAFDATLQEIERLGEVTDRSVDSEDITDQFVDVQGRLTIAKTSRDRLLSLLQNAKETKDVLSIEQEVRRLNEEIERMEGQLRVIDDRAQLATITVGVQERARPQTIGSRLESPFKWINMIGIEKLYDGSTWLYTPGPSWHFTRLFKGIPFKLATFSESPAPEGFVPISYYENNLLATTAGDSRLRVHRFEAEHKEEIGFWAMVLRKEFERQRGYEVIADEPFEIATKGLTGRVLRMETMFGGERWKYELYIVQRETWQKRLCTIEYARPVRESESDVAPTIDAAVKGMRVR